MGILSKILAALFGGVILLQLYATLNQSPVIDFLWTVIFCLPVTIALLGRGGKFLYIIALLSSWLLAGVTIIGLSLDIYLGYFNEFGLNNAQTTDLETGLVVGAVGLAAIAVHYCITRLHPIASRNILVRKLNSLFLDTMRRQAMAFGGNIILIVLVLEAGWMFAEVAIVYLYELVLITLFTVWIVRKQELFDKRHACFSNVTVDLAKGVFCTQHLGGYFVFYLIYLVIILMVGGLPTLPELGAISVVAVAWFLAHYFDALERHRLLRNKPLDLKAIENRHAWRILPIHLGCMLGILAIGDDDPGLALLFILIKMIFEIVQEATGYYRRRKQAIDKRRRRPAPLDLGSIAAPGPDPLMTFGPKAK